MIDGIIWGVRVLISVDAFVPPAILAITTAAFWACAQLASPRMQANHMLVPDASTGWGPIRSCPFNSASRTYTFQYLESSGTAVFPQGRITQLGGIVRSLRRLDFEIPADVEDELEITQTQDTAARSATAALQIARDNLHSVPASEFGSALEEFDRASIRAFATQNGDAGFISGVTAARLESAISRHYGEWIERTVKEYNSVVESKDLNNHGRNLPDLTNAYLRVLDLSDTQTAAISAWRPTGCS